MSHDPETAEERAEIDASRDARISVDRPQCPSRLRHPIALVPRHVACRALVFGGRDSLGAAGAASAGVVASSGSRAAAGGGVAIRPRLPLARKRRVTTTCAAMRAAAVTEAPA
eukprot:1260813-Prymnesium_polylepis.3